MAWKENLQAFFDERSEELVNPTSLEGLCYVSGRDPRLWAREDLYQDLVESLRDQAELGPECRLLEMGCASGFLAKGLAPLVKEYTGADLAASALEAAARLRLPNAHFRQADGCRLPFADGAFDRVIGYDVFTNFPNFEVARAVAIDMVRVAKPGGKVLIGSLADEEKKKEYEAAIHEVAERLNRECGPVQPLPVSRNWCHRLRSWYRRKLLKVQPEIFCYYFRRQDFLSLGEHLKARTEIRDIHRMNPYYSFRFNVIYTKGG